MNCETLAQRIQSLEPDAGIQDVARLCLLLCNSIDELDELESDETLTRVWRETSLRIQAATDQHEAMTQELEDLSRSDPAKFSQEHVWILIRAIKVQSRILELYLGGEAAIDV